ncbi:MAG: hypothetical protein IKY90_07595, partial [Oscillospiraceae bacterium]|nr:hypothetical protein [Oscillospiraceae bacterium]
RRAEAPLVCSLFSLPPSPFIRHWRRSTPSPTFWLLLAPKVTPAQRKKEFVLIQEQGFFTPAVFRMTEFWFCGNKIPRRFAHSE